MTKKDVVNLQLLTDEIKQILRAGRLGIEKRNILICKKLVFLESLSGNLKVEIMTEGVIDFKKLEFKVSKDLSGLDEVVSEIFTEIKGGDNVK